MTEMLPVSADEMVMTERSEILNHSALFRNGIAAAADE